MLPPHANDAQVPVAGNATGRRRPRFGRWQEPEVAPPRDRRAVAAVIATLFVVSVVSLIQSPVPAWLVAALALIGTVAAAITLLDEDFWTYLALGLLLFGTPAATAAVGSRIPDLDVESWQSMTIVFFAFAAALEGYKTVQRRRHARQVTTPLRD